MSRLLNVALILTMSLSSSYLAVKLPSLHQAYMLNHVGQSVVEIVERDPLTGQIMGGGTGFEIQHGKEKFILTNRHICEMYSKDSPVAILIEPDGTVTQRPILKISSITDLCIIASIDKLPALKLAKSVDIGQLVSVVGHPLLLPTTVTTGAIIQESVFQVDYMFIPAFLTTATTLPGNSGSPAVDQSGHVIGVVFAGDNQVHWGLVIPLEDVDFFLKYKI